MSRPNCIDSQRNVSDHNDNQIVSIDSIATITPNQNTNSLGCNYRNCTITGATAYNKSYRKNDVVFQTPQHVRTRKHYDREPASQPLVQNHVNGAILPPPLFDETAISSATLPLVPTESLRQIKSRRHHRTIPRHFTLGEPMNATSAMPPPKPKQNNDDASQNERSCTSSSTATGIVANNNKKSVCQCPVQHVPMSYMGSTHLNMTRSQPNEILLNTLSRKLSHQKSNVAKSASFTSSPVVTIAAPTVTQGYNRNSASGLLSANTTTANENISSAATSNNNSLHRQKTPLKISTISKPIDNNDLDAVIKQSLPSHSSNRKMSNELALASTASSESSAISDDFKTATVSPVAASSELFASPFPIQFIESMGKVKVKELSLNPVLPPKTLKNGTTPVQVANASRIQTISKPISTTSSTGATLPPDMNHSNQMKLQSSKRDFSKSPSRDRNQFQLAASVNQHSKTNYPTSSSLSLSNHYTLPKASVNKSSLNSTITDVVSKVPSIVNIPAQYVNKPTIKTHSSTATAMPIANVSTNNDSYSLLSADSRALNKSMDLNAQTKIDDKPLPVCTTYKNCSNPREHFLPNDTSLDDDYLSECENCKSAHGSRYYLDEEIEEQPQETMTLQRKMDEKEDEQAYYRTSSTLPTNTKKQT